MDADKELIVVKEELAHLRKRFDLASGLGAPARRAGLGADSYDSAIYRLAALSPQAAWAELTGAIKAPYYGSIVSSGFDTVADTLAAGDMDEPVLGTDTFVTDFTFDVQVPSAFAGNTLKTLYDFFYNKTSGILARIEVTGKPRYLLSTDFVPLSNIADILPRCDYPGWLLRRFNNLHIDFQAGSPLPFAPVIVNVTMRGWQYICPNLDQMSTTEAICRIADLGFNIDYLQKCRCNY